MTFARDEDDIYLHGSASNAMLGAIVATARCCLSFTVLDGLVFAKSAMHHSMNYRSVVAFGAAERVRDEASKRRASQLLLDQIAPGRNAETRPPNEAELRVTTVVRVRIAEASLKARSGPAVDDAADVPLDHYAGVLPLRLTAGLPTHEHRTAPVSNAVRARSEQLGAEPVVERPVGDVLLSSDPSRLDLGYVHRFLRDESYWVPGIDEPTVQRSLARSVCVGAYSGNEQVGFARAITDASRFAYLADIFVDSRLRGRGLGRALVEFLLRHPDVVDVQRVLLGTRDAHALYRKFGFDDIVPGRMMGLSRTPE
jgi:nitroimidazol reductase NimA-like FMN-containing flavoprotein (pyridoxamine 5'-phosphate oxidase superfamily)/GNAT superfamily N-acetyltransferase